MNNLLVIFGVCILAMYLFKMSKRSKKQRGGINKKALVAILVLVGISAVVGYFVWKNYHNSSPTPSPTSPNPSPTPSPTPSPIPCSEIQKDCSQDVNGSLSEDCCRRWAKSAEWKSPRAFGASNYHTIPLGCFRDMRTGAPSIWFNNSPSSSPPPCLTASPSPCSDEYMRSPATGLANLTRIKKINSGNMCNSIKSRAN